MGHSISGLYSTFSEPMIALRPALFFHLPLLTLAVTLCPTRAIQETWVKAAARVAVTMVNSMSPERGNPQR